MHLTQHIFHFVFKRGVFVLLASLLLLSLFTAAQSKRGNIWYFGDKAGLDFNSGTFPPVPLTDGQMTTTEGCASIADENGQLLFYTDGTNIWDRMHNMMPNANGSIIAVYTLALQPDGKILIGGSFTAYDGINRNNIARLNADGTLDMTFNPGTGANNKVNVIALQPDGKIIIGGDFTDYNGIGRNCIARLNDNGTLDMAFNPGTGATNGGFGSTPTVQAIALQPDEKIIIGGLFTTYNGTGRNRIARLNDNGTLDMTFNPGTGTDNIVYAIALQPDGKIIIGGGFTDYNGTGRNRIARLNDDGTLDMAFDPGTGANSSVYAMVLQPDGKIIIGGLFTTYNGTGRNRIARLNDDGTLDMTFDPGTGADNSINTILLLADGKMIIGGGFTTYNGTVRNRIARLNANGTLAFSPGTGANNKVNTIALLADGKMIIGGGGIVAELTEFDGIRRGGLVLLNSNGSVDETVFKDYWHFMLSGDQSSSQASIITPMIGSSNRYYVFTTDGKTSSSFIGPKGKWDGLHYTVVDMTLNGGLGDIDTAFIRNLGYAGNKIPLADDIDEKVTAAVHANGVDYWIITQKHFTGDFYAFKIGCSGVDTTPVITYVGSFGLGATLASSGCLTASHDGKSLAAAYWIVGTNFWLCDFNNITGEVTDIQTITNMAGASYGTCFSPNDSIVYVSASGSIRRYNRFTLEEGNVINSPEAWALALGPDKRIYITRYPSAFLNVLHQPDNFDDPVFEANAVPLASGISLLGLPNFFNLYAMGNSFGNKQSYETCPGDSILIGYGIDDTFTIQWMPAAGLDNPNIANPKSFPDTTTVYIARLISTCDTLYDTVTVHVLVPEIDLGADTSICEGEEILLHAGIHTAYLWSTGDTSASIEVGNTGQYTVWVTDTNGCSNIDSVEILYVSLPQPTSSVEDTTVCSGSVIIMEASGGDTYTWTVAGGETLSGEPQIEIYPEESTTYILISENECGDTGIINIPIEVISCNYMVPNAFSPNTDNSNDQWQISGEDIEDLHVIIYDRFGKLMFESENQNTSWDGTFNDKPVPAGVYMYVARIGFPDGASHQVRGNIQVVR